MKNLLLLITAAFLVSCASVKVSNETEIDSDDALVFGSLNYPKGSFAVLGMEQQENVKIFQKLGIRDGADQFAYRAQTGAYDLVSVGGRTGNTYEGGHLDVILFWPNKRHGNLYDQADRPQYEVNIAPGVINYLGEIEAREVGKNAFELVVVDDFENARAAFAKAYPAVAAKYQFRNAVITPKADASLAGR